MRTVRPGILGKWDRFVGPGATTVENVGTVALGVAGAVLAPRLKRNTAHPAGGAFERLPTLLVQLMAADLWGGAWCNNTPAAHWYQRPGQGSGQHLLFAAAHVHPLLLATLDRKYGERASSWWWAAAHYTYLITTTALVARGGRRRRRLLGLTTAAGGVVLDRLLGASFSAPWFAPVYYAKLLAGHAAGAAVLPTDPLRTQQMSR